MKRLRLWLTRILLGLLALAIVLSLAGTWFVTRTWPDTNGTITASGLTAPVKVIRDKWGVPHIYAENERDLLFAQGYVHAQDRLWQMELNRRAGRGTLSEALGKPTIGTDKWLRLMGLLRAAEKTWSTMGPENRALLQAYADGVNAFIDTHRDRLPVEFTILGVNPAPWTPVDSIAYGNVMTMSLSANYTLELLRAKMIAQVGESVTQQLFPPPVTGTPIIIPDGVNGYNGLRNSQFADLDGVSQWVGLPDPGLGSNDWVVSGSRTATGKPFLANDTHLGLGMPSIWYESDLHGGRFNAAGFSFSGVPLIILGHNNRIAWGTSNLGNDNQDSYLEKLNDLKNPTQYEYKGQWLDLKVIPETIIVKGSDPVKMNILMTQHGPIMNAENLDTEDPLAMRWTIQEGNDLFASIVKINTAANWNDFHEALRLWDAPGQNFVYADVDGNIGYHSSGKTPIRVPGHLGTLPVPGWTGEYEWQDYVPFEDMPKVLNPPSGYVATANNKITPDGYPVLAQDFYPGFRAQRIVDMLSASDKLTIEDMQKAHADTLLLPAKILRPYLLAMQPENDLQAQALAKVKDWDLRIEADSVGGAIYEVWFLFLVRNTIGDELGSDLLTTYLAGGYQRHSSQIVPLMINLLPDAVNAFFDDKNTSEVEKRDDIVLRSLREAVALLGQKCGGNIEGWKWGCIHTITFKHQPFGGIPVLSMIFNGPTLPARGERFSVNAGAFNNAYPFEMVHGSSQRLIVDLGNLNNSLGILITGQSELLFHPHRTDMIQKWQNVQYDPLLFTQEAAQANAEAVMMLVPQTK